MEVILDPNVMHEDGWFDRERRQDVEELVDELSLSYPQEDRTTVAHALFQARKNLSPEEGLDRLKEEVGRLLGLLAVLQLKAEVEAQSA